MQKRHKLIFHSAETHRRDLEAISSQLQWRLNVFDAPSPIYHGINRHNAIRLFFVRAGTGSVRAEGQADTLFFKVGYGYFLPSRKLIEFHLNEGLRLFCLDFQLEVIPGINLFDTGGVCVEFSLGEVEFARLEALYRAPYSWETFFDFEEYRQHLFKMLLPYVSKNVPYEEFRAKLLRYAKLFEYIRNRADAQTTVEQLAAVQNLSYDRLCRIFRKDFNASLMDVLGAELCHRAEHLLTESDLSVKEISGRLGFANEFYFSRFFKKRALFSPSEFRGQYRRSFEVVKEDTPPAKKRQS